MSDDDWCEDYNSEVDDDEVYGPLEDDGDDATGSMDRTEPVYKLVNRESLLSAQLEDLRKVADVLGIRMHHARSLLIYHRWDVEALFGKLADQGEERLFLSAGIPPRVDAERAKPLKPEEEITCRICFVDVPGREATQMDCGHAFCNDCWTQYFVIKIKDGQSRRITCMQEKCSAICDEDKIWTLVRSVDKDAADRFERSLLESYIEDNSKVKWCPSVPHCGNAISVDGEPYCELECVCKHTFCFNCLAQPHSPCSCEMWQLWDRKCKDESETLNWLTANTKPCPKCKKPVEKNGGCNLVGCVCGQAFCWLCGAATGREHTWTSIQGHSCGRYKEEKEQEAQKAQSYLKRYIHYHSRWKGHIDSLNLEEKKRLEAYAHIAKLEASESQVKDYTWLTNGLQRLFRARRALSYSYAFAFYMFGGDLFKEDISVHQNEINQNLFEDQQQQLEETVERLSKLVETNLEFGMDEEEIQKVRMDVINLTALTDTLCKRMYDVIENDLLGSLELTTHHIAPYRSQGYEQVVEVTDTDAEKASHILPSAKHGKLPSEESGPSSRDGEVIELDKATTSAEPTKSTFETAAIAGEGPRFSRQEEASTSSAPHAKQKVAEGPSEASKGQSTPREKVSRRNSGSCLEESQGIAVKRKPPEELAFSPRVLRPRMGGSVASMRSRSQGDGKGASEAVPAAVPLQTGAGLAAEVEVPKLSLDKGKARFAVSGPSDADEPEGSGAVAAPHRDFGNGAGSPPGEGGSRRAQAHGRQRGRGKGRSTGRERGGRGGPEPSQTSVVDLDSPGAPSPVAAAQVVQVAEELGADKGGDADGSQGTNAPSCPVCFLQFEKTAPYDLIHAHVDQCLAEGL